VFDHIGIVVKDLEVARAFYSACLAPLMVELLEDHSQASGEGWLVYGTAGSFPFFVVGAGRPSFWGDSHVASSAPDHLAFTAPSDRAVDAFYRAGLVHGGRDNGPPGPRRSSTRCYAAFLIDPDGNNVEASHRERSAACQFAGARL
jgi:catechol 2,3-dioxygenase-like lactoylglutathione lyase family enzyme